MLQLDFDAPQDLAGSWGDVTTKILDEKKISNPGDGVKHNLLAVTIACFKLCMAGLLLRHILPCYRDILLQQDYSREISGLVDCCDALIEAGMVLHG